MKRLYRIFKSECPSGLITEEVFHNIFSKFFPLGAENYNGKTNKNKKKMLVNSNTTLLKFNENIFSECKFLFTLCFLCSDN